MEYYSKIFQHQNCWQGEKNVTRYAKRFKVLIYVTSLTYLLSLTQNHIPMEVERSEKIKFLRQLTQELLGVEITMKQEC